MSRSIVPLTGKIQPYAWGSTTAIPALLGIEPTGEPQAELWLGAHPSAPSVLAAGSPPSVLAAGSTLADLIASDPSVLGKESVKAFGPRLPFLLKILAAAQPLSLQAHPSRAQAEAGFAREEAAGVARDAPDRMYRDDWPKPEIIVALEPFEALYGFADQGVTASLADRLGDDWLIDWFAPLRQPGGSLGLQQVFAASCQLPSGDPQVAQVIEAARARVGDSDAELARWCRTAVEVGDRYPGDPGVLAALLMNRMSLTQYQALFLPAGNLHAYLHGTGVELMANSDNVLRGGLTSKHVDVAELISVLNFTATEPVALTATAVGSGYWRYETPAPEFSLWRLEVAGEPLELPMLGSARIVLATAGECQLDDQRLTPGSAVFAPAGAKATLSGAGTVFVAGPGH